MALRDSKILRAIFYAMGGLLFLGFALRVYLVISTEGAAAQYHGGRGLPIFYSSAGVLLVVLVAVFAFVGVAWLINRLRDRRDRGGDV